MPFVSLLSLPPDGRRGNPPQISTQFDRNQAPSGPNRAAIGRAAVTLGPGTQNVVLVIPSAQPFKELLIRQLEAQVAPAANGGPSHRPERLEALVR